ncbi:MAG: hypothetical protein IKC03_00385 [Oscillospiraceae bacterium]|nr:hypothetical protein [Oscillospiraceae bacterium]
MPIPTYIQISYMQTIHGIRYITVSHFSGEQDLFDKMQSIIAEAYRNSETTDHLPESSTCADMVCK